MLIHLPDPVGVRVVSASQNADTAEVRLAIRDAGHAQALFALLEKALKDGYAIELRLIDYEGQRDMVEQARVRKQKKAVRVSDP